MSVRVKIYLITEKSSTGCENIIAARLTNEAAREIAKQRGNRRVTKLIATKDLELGVNDLK